MVVALPDRLQYTRTCIHWVNALLIAAWLGYSPQTSIIILGQRRRNLPYKFCANRKQCSNYFPMYTQYKIQIQRYSLIFILLHSYSSCGAMPIDLNWITCVLGFWAKMWTCVYCIPTNNKTLSALWQQQIVSHFRGSLTLLSMYAQCSQGRKQTNST